MVLVKQSLLDGEALLVNLHGASQLASDENNHKGKPLLYVKYIHWTTNNQPCEKKEEVIAYYDWPY